MKKTLIILTVLSVLLLKKESFAFELAFDFSNNDISKECNIENYRNYIFPDGSEYKDVIYKASKGCNLFKADLSGINLSETNLSGAYLSEANLTGTNLSGSYLNWADLTEAILHDAILDWADLSRANLIWAELNWADLTEAILHDAILIETDLMGANLIETDLSGARLINCKNLSSIKCNSGTDFPGPNLLFKYINDLTCEDQ
ncbi:MAG: pentapeptide repeat-containing protein [Bdellovibrionaceae bacterium]|nr:pentapeptide repeat-containing protein [Pseudobdellovibrionaceae bacterium]